MDRAFDFSALETFPRLENLASCLVFRLTTIAEYLNDHVSPNTILERNDQALHTHLHPR